MMRRGVLPFLCLLLLLCAFIPGAASAAGNPLKVRVGVYENPPKIFTDEEGNVSGFWADIVAYIAQEEDWEVEWVHGSWTECLERLENGEIDMMPDVAYTVERGATYQFPSESVYTSWSMVYVREGSTMQSLLDLEGKTVAVLQGSVNVEGPNGIKELLKAFNVSCTFDEVGSYSEVFARVADKDADAGVVSKDHGYRYSAEFGLVETPIIFQPSPLYFAFPKGAGLTPSLVERTDHHVRDLKKNSDSVYYQSLQRWFTQEHVATPFIPRWVILTLAGIVGLALLLGVGSLLLRSQVNARTKELVLEIARRKEAEQELSRSHEHLEDLVSQRTMELEQANRHKSQFLANMSHELRTPLNSIIGYTKLMLDGMEGAVTTDQKEDLQTVYDNSKHLLSLINDLLDLSKIEAGKFEIVKDEFPVSDLVSQVVPSMEKLARDKGLELTCTVAPGIDRVYADKNKTKQILFNLLGNAVKFTQKGSVRLDIGTRDGEFVFSVIDTGVGISPQDIGRLFESYKQVGPARLDGSEGTGLGLVISKQFVELQGGRIWVESTQGQGSTFSFALPAK
ncbi:MAG: ATP-binding protein [Dehalococcoidia bacterium]|jgi:hypothetical protein|nr:ATP-binding protein [Dehalococcoidia bacterium]